MYIEKLKYFRKNYAEDNCIAGITTVAHNDMLVGTPCIIYSRPFVDNYSKVDYVKNSGEPFLTPFTNWSDPQDPQSKPEKKKSKATREGGKISLKQVYEIAKEAGIAEANEVILTSLGEVTVLFLFNVWNDSRDHYSCNVRSSQVYFNGSTPLIFDKYKQVDLKRLRDVHSKSEIKNFSDLIMEDLKNYRYVNYTFREVSGPSKTLMQEDLNNIYDAIKRPFPINICFFRWFASRARANTVSVSFYRLPDVMPVFDYKRSIGVGMEIFLTNSETNIDLRSDSVGGATYRFLFAKDRENVFTIDGEPIKRPNDRPSNKCLVEIQSIIYDVAPNHKKLEAF